MTNTQKNFIIGAIVIILALVAYCAFALSVEKGCVTTDEQATEVVDYSTSDETYLLESLTPEIQNELGKLVFDAVEKKTKGDWDKMLDIIAIDSTQRAAYGSWSAWDKDSWVAWKDVSGVWRIAVSQDAYVCDEIEKIPADIKPFFGDKFGAPSEAPYCI